MYRKIMVAVDGGECSRSALENAIEIARCSKAQLEIVHAINYKYLQFEISYGVHADPIPAVLASGREILRQAGALAEKSGVAHSEKMINDILRMGDVAGLLEEHVEASKPDVVVGTHGRHGLKRLLLGSVAERLARTCPRPVLLVRAPATTNMGN